MGAVYRAWDTRLNTPVALKEMIPQPELDQETLSQLRYQFRQEAQILARLSHPHLVDVTDFFEEGGNVYLVMKFVEGESLAERIEREGALPEDQVLTWAHQLLDALAYCHDQGIIHRDVKPQNVIIRPGQGAVLVDFGLVKLWDPSDPRTRTAMRGMGTPEYAPPEQYDVQGGHTDPRSDVYGLGATIYHALSGQVPPTATQRIVNPGKLAPIRTLRPEVSPHVEAAVTRALELQPEARFKNAREMQSALTGKVAVAPLHSPTVKAAAFEPSPAPEGPNASRTWISLAAGAVIVVMIVVGGLMVGAALWLGGRDAPPPATASASVPPATQAVLADTPLATETGSPPTSAPPTDAPASSPPTATAKPTSTPSPTGTPRHTSTPLPTPTPTPACPGVGGPFAGVWESVQEQLGCAVGTAHTSWMASERFERGQMLWRQDTDAIVVLYDNGTWVAYQDVWNEGDAEYSCPESAPEESPPTPKRGFGKIWCIHPGVRSGLGWATDQERGFDGAVQDFERGTILRMDSGAIYVLYGDGTWVSW